MSDVSFGIIGGGWRAEFFLRIAAALPERFGICGMQVRDEAKGRALEKAFGVRTYRTQDELLSQTQPLFVVVSVPTDVAPEILHSLADRDVPALCETPPGSDVEALTDLHALVRAGARIQVAEQYIFQPMHAARLAIARSGRLGAVSQARVAVAHGYHGISLIRHLLGVTFEAPTISAFSFASGLIAGPGRDGPPTEQRTDTSAQTLALLDFGDRLGVYDFSSGQYFSWVRAPRVLVRGDRGEICNTTVKYLADFQTPIEVELRRQDAGHGGNLEGYYHKGVLAGDEWVYTNPFTPGPLADDELAIATSLDRMANYVRTGAAFYSLAEAAQDRYLDLLVAEACQSGQPIEAEIMPWAG